MNLLSHFRETRLVPVADVASAQDALPLAGSLLEAGLSCIEITLRTAAAIDAIKAVSSEFPELLVGAGTVRSVEQADDAVAAGACFLVSPGLNERVIRYSAELDVPIVPGVCTPSEVERALGMDLSLLKFFPAEAAGGVAYLKALSGPSRDVQFLPSGGVGPSNLSSYLGLPNVVACGGSWMVSPSLIASGDFATITRLSSEAVSIAAVA